MFSDIYEHSRYLLRRYGPTMLFQTISHDRVGQISRIKIENVAQTLTYQSPSAVLMKSEPHFQNFNFRKMYENGIRHKRVGNLGPLLKKDKKSKI